MVSWIMVQITLLSELWEYLGMDLLEEEFKMKCEKDKTHFGPLFPLGCVRKVMKNKIRISWGLEWDKSDKQMM